MVRPSTALAISSLLALTTAAYSNSSQTGWPSTRGDSANTGRGVGKGAKGEIAWNYFSMDDIFTSTVVGPDGTLYYGDNGGYTYAIEPVDRKPLWSYRTKEEIFAAPTLAPDGTVYVASTDHFLYALDGKTGLKKWSFQTKDTITSSPTVGPNGIVYVTSHDGKVYALNAKGKLVWSHRAGDAIFGAAAVANGVVVVGTHDGKVVGWVDGKGKIVGLSAETGKVLWQVKANNFVDSTPAIATDGTVYIGSHDHRFFALNAKTGKQKWIFKAGDWINTGASIGTDGTIYFGSGDKKVYALNGKTGAKKWSLPFGGSIEGISLGGDGTLYATSVDQQLHAIDTKSGKVKWNVVVEGCQGCSPAIGDDGTVYISGGSGTKMYAVK